MIATSNEQTVKLIWLSTWNEIISGKCQHEEDFFLKCWTFNDVQINDIYFHIITKSNWKIEQAMKITPQISRTIMNGLNALADTQNQLFVRKATHRKLLKRNQIGILYSKEKKKKQLNLKWLTLWPWYENESNHEETAHHFGLCHFDPIYARNDETFCKRLDDTNRSLWKATEELQLKCRTPEQQ